MRKLIRTTALAIVAAGVRYRWCEIRHDPKNDDFVAGRVYGRYISRTDAPERGRPVASAASPL